MLKQYLQQKLLQKLSPQQIQLMKLIQLPTIELEERIKNELEDNPALAEGVDQKEDLPDETESITAEDINIDEYLSDDEIPAYRLHANNTSPDDEEKTMPMAVGQTFHESLSRQLGTFPLDDHLRNIAEYIIGCIDEGGYLRREVLDIVDDLAFNQNVVANEAEVEKLLQLVQTFEPVGVGARNLRECLLLQLRQRQSSAAQALAIVMLEKCFASFAKKHYKKIMARLHIDEAALKAAIHEVERLNPKPGGSVAGANNVVQQITPDFTINIIEGCLELSLNARNAPEMHVSYEYREMLKGYQVQKEKATREQKEAVLFVKQKLDSAKWFIDAIKQRQDTLMRCMTAIMHFQEAYFLSGDERKIKPMILKDIAEEIEMDISTVSRVSSSKYVATPYGTMLIKELFSESMQNAEGEDVSTREIKKSLQELVAAENPSEPLTDQALADQLKAEGYPIARRTITKYREQLNIPVGRMRKKL